MDFYVNRGHSPLKEGLTAYRYGSTYKYYIEYLFEIQADIIKKFIAWLF